MCATNVLEAVDSTFVFNDAYGEHNKGPCVMWNIFSKFIGGPSITVIPPNMPKPIDHRSQFERMRDGYTQLIDSHTERLKRVDRRLEQLRTDKEEIEAILVSLHAANDALNNEVLTRGLLGNDAVIKSIENGN